MPYRKKGTPEEESIRFNNLALEAALLNGGSVEFKFAESTMTSLNFTCAQGHTFTKSIRAVISRGGWCDFCRQDIPANQNEATLTLGKSGWTLLSEYKSGLDQLKVRCAVCGNERLGPFRYFEGKPCHHKSQSGLKPSVRVAEIVSTLGGKVLSENISNLDSRIDFECREGHRFTLVGRSVVTRRTWCKECSQTGVTHRKMTALIHARGGSLVEEIPKRLTSSTKVVIQCSMGHEFVNDWEHLKPPRNGWCSICTKGNKSEEIARVTFKQIFGGDFRKARPDWLRNSRGFQMELDGYEDELKLAFEYQGRQHFEDKGIYSSKHKLTQRIEDDLHKAKLCFEHGVTLIALTWEMEYEDFPITIRNQLLTQRPELVSIGDFTSPINFSKAFIKDDRLDELRIVLKSRNLNLLSDKWISVSYKYDISCNECGYQFKQPARAYLNSRKVAGCKKCAMKQTALDVGKRKLGLHALNAVAASFGGECLSTEYKTSRTKYKWRCSRGHIFERTMDSIKGKQSFCTPCAFGVPTLGELTIFAESKGGTLLTAEYGGSMAHYLWRCSLGHDFQRTWANMRTSKNFCPKCRP
jgi:hypothetical protein